MFYSRFDKTLFQDKGSMSTQATSTQPLAHSWDNSSSINNSNSSRGRTVESEQPITSPSTNSESQLPTELDYQTSSNGDPWDNISTQPDEKTFVLKKQIAGELPCIGSCMKIYKQNLLHVYSQIRGYYNITSNTPYTIRYTVKEKDTSNEAPFFIEVPPEDSKFTDSAKKTLADCIEVMYCQLTPMSVLVI